MIPAGDEDALDDPSGDVPDGEGLALPSRDRIEDNRSSDVRDDEQELQERCQVDLVVLSATRDVPGWVVEHGLEERERRIDVMNVTMNRTPKMRPCI